MQNTLCCITQSFTFRQTKNIPKMVSTCKNFLCNFYFTNKLQLYLFFSSDVIVQATTKTTLFEEHTCSTKNPHNSEFSTSILIEGTSQCSDESRQEHICWQCLCWKTQQQLFHQIFVKAFITKLASISDSQRCKTSNDANCSFFRNVNPFIAVLLLHWYSATCYLWY